MNGNGKLLIRSAFDLNALDTITLFSQIMQTSNTPYTLVTFPRLGTTKKQDGVDKGTNRKTPGNNEGARPPREKDLEKIKDKKNENHKNP